MRNLALACLLLLSSFIASAQPSGTGATILTWTPATSYTDGTFMVLAEQRVYAARTATTVCGVSPAIADFEQIGSVEPGIASVTFGSLWNGGWYYYATSVDVFGNESDPSNVVCNSINITRNWPPPGQGVKPMPPGQLKKLE